MDIRIDEVPEGTKVVVDGIHFQKRNSTWALLYPDGEVARPLSALEERLLSVIVAVANDYIL